MISRIKTREELEKRKRRNYVITGSVMIVLLVLSSAGFALLSSDGSNSVNSGGEGPSVSDFGHTFYSTGVGTWEYLSGDGQVFTFWNLPSEVSEVVNDAEFDVGQFVNKPLYIVGDTNEAITVLGHVSRYVQRYQEACLEGFDCSGTEFPVKSCEDSNIVVFGKGIIDGEEVSYVSEALQQEVDPTIDAIYTSGGCTYFVGNSLRTADAFAYKLLKIL